MSTTMVTKESVTRKWYVLDAAGKPLGKTAALAADILRGKLKTDYTPHVDCGDSATTSSSSTPRTPSSPARSWSRSTTVPTPVTPAG